MNFILSMHRNVCVHLSRFVTTTFTSLVLKCTIRIEFLKDTFIQGRIALAQPLQQSNIMSQMQVHIIITLPNLVDPHHQVAQ